MVEESKRPEGASQGNSSDGAGVQGPMGPGQRGGAAQGRSGERSSKDLIETRLREGLAAEHVEVIDESHLHVGHAGAASGGGHFRAVIVSERFAGLSRLQAQRLVYAALGDAMGGAIHAFSMTTLSPAQWRERGEAREP